MNMLYMRRILFIIYEVVFTKYKSCFRFYVDFVHVKLFSHYLKIVTGVTCRKI